MRLSRSLLKTQHNVDDEEEERDGNENNMKVRDSAVVVVVADARVHRFARLDDRDTEKRRKPIQRMDCGSACATPND